MTTERGLDLTLLARAGYEAILNSLKGETDEEDIQTAKKAHIEGKLDQRADRCRTVRSAGATT